MTLKNLMPANTSKSVFAVHEEPSSGSNEVNCGKEPLCNGLLKAEILASPFIEHGFFGRESGFSEGVYASLNCSNYVGDDALNVAKNLEIVRNCIGARKLITLKQCSENKCLEVNNDTPSTGLMADAMVTAVPGLAIGVLAADCVPILFFDEKNKIIAAAHAGWRGAVSGIVESTVDKIIRRGADLDSTKVAIGPCIGPNSYEVSDDFSENFTDGDDCFCSFNGKLHFNLAHYCQTHLLKSGLREQNIQLLSVDTVANNSCYFSHRAACKSGNGVCGRNISVICLRNS
ncbi:MAG: polyphenol oxidase family protein [Holosporaceae bacterium]|jgi:YfiH family protein|nr:polyphenol oxidase family protein [Holosporaceae bacterium]